MIRIILSGLKAKIKPAAICFAALMVSVCEPALAAPQDEFCAGFEEGFRSIEGDMAILPICPIEPITSIGSTPFREGIKVGIAAARGHVRHLGEPAARQPYDYTMPNPMIAFEQAYNFGNAQAQQQAAQQRAQEQQEALQSIRTDRSPENLARVTLLFPDLGKKIADSESILNADQIKSDNSFRAEVIMLYKSNPDAARARLVKQAEGYANTPGMEKQAAAAQEMLKSYDNDPNSVILPMTIQLAQSDEKLYETLFGAGEATAFQPD